MTDAEIVANLFDCPPCEFSPIDEEMDEEECERICGSDEQTDAKCWQRYFDLKRKEENEINKAGLHEASEGAPC